MTVRVIQWATGPVGSGQMREVINNPDLELAGVLVYSPEKAGKDAGDLIGLPATGIVATDDKAAILALDADVVLHSASKSFGFEQNTDDIVALLESGKDVISVTSYAHLSTLGQEVHDRIAAACERGSSRFHAAGEHPGFVFERLALTLTAMSQRVDRVILRQYIDCTHVPEERMLVGLMGMGKDPGEINIDSPAFRSVSVQAEQALAAGADVLGLKFDEITHTIKTGVVDHDVKVDCTTLPAGTVVGQVLSWSATVAGVPVLTCEEYWTCTSDIPGWDISSGTEHAIRIEVAGIPNMQVELVIDTDPVEEFGGLSGGYVGTGMTAINAIADVRRAPSGIVIPDVFGTFRFKQSARSLVSMIQ